ncbi:MAG: hypothetical protein IK089_00895 [Oxalobacter sp.]|nr:hypothetical protein [Oxalobacter sp.]
MAKPCPAIQTPDSTDIDQYLDWTIDLLEKYRICAARHQSVVQAWPK